MLQVPHPGYASAHILHQYSFRDGLQSYFLVKCMSYHLVVAEFPSSLPIGSKATEAINDSQMLTHITSMLIHNE